MKSMIQKFSEAIGPPGYETSIRSMIQDEIASLVDEMKVDNLGNLIARKGRLSEKGKKIMFFAHMDEVGLMISHVDSMGFARFVPLGELQIQTMVGSQIQFLNGAKGVVGYDALKNKGKELSFDQLFIDCGATSADECPVKIGDTGVFNFGFSDLGSRLVGKALDDRVGVCILIETLRRMQHGEFLSPHELSFVFSSQEQVGSRGAPSAAFRSEPEIGIKVGLIPSGDTPKTSNNHCKLGKGPAISFRDAHSIPDSNVVNWISQTANKNEIPHQSVVIARVYGEVDTVQLSREGVAAGGVFVPARYLHSGVEMVDLEDVENAVRLLAGLIISPVEL